MSVPRQTADRAEFVERILFDKRATTYIDRIAPPHVRLQLTLAQCVLDPLALYDRKIPKIDGDNVRQCRPIDDASARRRLLDLVVAADIPLARAVDYASAYHVQVDGD